MSPPPPLNLVHIAAPAHVGGLERVVQGLAIGLHKRGHGVSVLAIVGPGVDATPFTGRMLDAGVEVHTLTVPRRRYLMERRMVRGLLRERRPDVVHTHGYRPDILDSGVARSLSIPTMTTVHGASFMGGLSTIYEWLQERSYRRFDRVVAVSSALADSLSRIGVDEDRVVVIRNAWEGADDFLHKVEARRQLGLPTDGWVFGWVGRMIAVKGGDLFLRALSELEQAGWRAAMIGDGPMRDGWRALAADLGIGSNVLFTGAVADARRLYRAFDTFVLSSSSEGMPVVLFEAMAAQVPIVATSVGGVPEILDDSTAFLVPPKDSAALSRTLAHVRAAADDATDRALHARARLERDFAMEAWISKYEDLYVELRTGR